MTVDPLYQKFTHDMGDKVCGIIGYLDLLESCNMDAEAKEIVKKLGNLCNDTMRIMGPLRELFIKSE